MPFALKYPVLATATAALVSCAISLGGCSSSKSPDSAASGSAQAGPGSAAATAAPDAATAAAVAAGGSATTDLPVYPGATKLPAHGTTAITSCGHKISVVAYQTPDGAQKVADWYGGRLSGATTITQNVDPNSTMIEVLASDGGEGVVVTQMHYAGDKLQAAAKTIGADQTTVGLTRYEPPLTQAEIALTQQGASGDAAAKKAAREKLESSCSGG